ncbi:MAG: Sec-independent protein translocase protein TatB [Porticoccaceae bacterium]|nr:Sec-independent protein translocase protein TatB [Porticoccaceae bacterium]
MFDIGFTELLVVAVVALVVIGPERLPETIRSVALWLGRLRRMASQVYREMEKEVGMNDIRQQLHNEEVMRSLGEGGKQNQQPENRPTAPAQTQTAPAPEAPPETDGKKHGS